MLLCLKELIQSNYVSVSGPFENNNFLHNFFGLGFFGQVLLVDWFDSSEFLGQFVQSQVDFTESSFAKYFADSVEVYCGLRWVIVLSEW